MREAARVAAEEAEREATCVAAEEAEREAARVATEEAEREAARVAAELNRKWPKGEWDVVMLQLNWELVNIAWSKAKTAKFTLKARSLRSERESLSRQLRDLGESVLTKDELTNRVTALYENLNLSYDELFEEATDEAMDAAEKCEEALTQLETQMALVVISLSVTGNDAPVKSDSESEFKVGDNAITLANSTAQHRSDILFGSFEVSSFSLARKARGGHQTEHYIP
jgi:hypothetical protein